jgi:hypothetical protein
MIQINNFFNGWMIFVIILLGVIGVINYNEIIDVPFNRWLYIVVVIYAFFIRFIQIRKIKQ